MKRLVVVSLVLFLLIAMLAGCQAMFSLNEKISIVCTVFPQYDWVRQILGGQTDDIEVTLLLDGLIDLHNFQPSVDDMVKISACDVFIYVGGESDKWVDPVLEEAANSNMTVINLLEVLGHAAKAEETVEGMEEEEETHAKKDEYDEHVWLSLRNAQVFCSAIAEALFSLDAQNAGIYQNNLTAYIEKLSALDSDYQTAVDDAPVKTLLFGDRFPFRYLVDDYGLRYYAAFAGCSAETEASFETIIFLANKADELSLKNIMVTESADQSIARTIISNTTAKNQQILVLNAMQSITAGDVENGITYLSIMENNLAVLKDALK